MPAWKILALIAFTLVAAVSSSAHAAETVVAEQACTLEGFPRPLRQTIAVIDEVAIEPWTGGQMSDNNRRWINAVIGLAGVQEGQRNESAAAPRERITVLLARANGSDLVRVFTGCPPTFSRDEIEKLDAESTGFTRAFNVWLGKDPKSRVEADQKAFRISLLGALVQLTKDTVKAKSASEFLSLLPDVGRSIDLGSGIPRIVIFSPLIFSNGNFDSKAAAREAGFKQASRSAADLKRAEVYVVRGKNELGVLARDYVTALLLGSKGFLVDVSGETLPALREAPEMIAVYGGFVPYGLINAPMQIRLAVDRSGSLVNSWVEVSVDRATATPMTGKAICKDANLDNCTIQGDGKDFSQAWATDPDPNKPTFDQKLPFSGIRWFQFATSPKGVAGNFYDPMVIVNKQKEMPFELERTAHVKF
jgi:hypothetical protein